jgi:hypothetical protein
VVTPVAASAIIVLDLLADIALLAFDLTVTRQGCGMRLLRRAP